MIYDAQGHVLTNNHVIAGAQNLVASLPDGRSFPAKLIGADPRTDLAVIQIQDSSLPTAALGDSDQMHVGDWVVAIGNSGGPLVNLAGQVIGINTLVAGQAEPGVPAQGIGFALSMATVKPLADQLVANGKATHAYVGISYVPLSPAVAAQLGIRATTGIAVADVAAGSPAEKAGLKPRDVITAIDGKPLQGESDFAQAISTHKPGDTVTLTVLRGSQQLSIKVTLGTLPAP